MSLQMYSVVINGVTIQCQTAADAIRLANEVAASNSASLPMQPERRMVSIPLPSVPVSPPPVAPPVSQVAMPGLAGETQSKWTESAKKVIALLVQAGDVGLDAERVATAADIKGSRGNAPLLKAVIELLGVGDGAIERSRNDEGKRRWVLTAKGRKAAAKLDLPQVEAG